MARIAGELVDVEFDDGVTAATECVLSIKHRDGTRTLLVVPILRMSDRNQIAPKPAMSIRKERRSR